MNVNSVGHEGQSTLMWAAMWGKTAIVQYLLDNGADPTIVNSSGKTAAQLAYEHGYFDLAALIEQYQPTSAAS